MSSHSPEYDRCGKGSPDPTRLFLGFFDIVNVGLTKFRSVSSHLLFLKTAIDLSNPVDGDDGEVQEQRVSHYDACWNKAKMVLMGFETAGTYSFLVSFR